MPSVLVLARSLACEGSVAISHSRLLAPSFSPLPPSVSRDFLQQPSSRNTRSSGFSSDSISDGTAGRARSSLASMRLVIFHHVLDQSEDFIRLEMCGNLLDGGSVTKKKYPTSNRFIACAKFAKFFPSPTLFITRINLALST